VKNVTIPTQCRRDFDAETVDKCGQRPPYDTGSDFMQLAYSLKIQLIIVNKQHVAYFF